jgi:hypothetical protein
MDQWKHGVKNMNKYVLSVDPGKATGIALLYLAKDEDPKIIFSGEAQPEEFAGVVRNILEDFTEDYSALTVVCEKFTINAQTVRNSQAPYSLEQIGALKQILQDFGIDRESIVWQMPVDAKKMFPNETLKTLEIWHKGGEGHANDALRHALLRLVKGGWIPRKLLQ